MLQKKKRQDGHQGRQKCFDEPSLGGKKKSSAGGEKRGGKKGAANEEDTKFCGGGGKKKPSGPSEKARRRNLGEGKKTIRLERGGTLVGDAWV